MQLDGNVSDYLVELGHFLGQESHDFPGLINLGRKVEVIHMACNPSAMVVNNINNRALHFKWKGCIILEIQIILILSKNIKIDHCDALNIYF